MGLRAGGTIWAGTGIAGRAERDELLVEDMGGTCFSIHPLGRVLSGGGYAWGAQHLETSTEQGPGGRGRDELGFAGDIKQSPLRSWPVSGYGCSSRHLPWLTRHHHDAHPAAIARAPHPSSGDALLHRPASKTCTVVLVRAARHGPNRTPRLRSVHGIFHPLLSRLCHSASLLGTPPRPKQTGTRKIHR